MEIEDLFWVLPYALLAVVMYSLYFWKTARGRSLLAKSRELIDAGKLPEGADLLKEALWKANEKPELEHAILDELANVYQVCGHSFDSQDYVLLISQYQGLEKKGSTKSLQELQKVQMLKKQVIDGMPKVA